MTEKIFNEIFEKRLALTREIMMKKRQEYAKDPDRLHNFNRAAAMLQCTPAQALVGMWTKHIISILDIVNNNKPVPVEMIEEKIGDAVNYLILLEAILKDTN